MIRQLRSFYTEEELAALYARPYDHTRWEDHRIRVQVTTHLGRWMRDRVRAVSGADFSAGDGAILRGCHLETSIYGDRAGRSGSANPMESWRVVNIEDPDEWRGLEVGLFILSETLEHLRDPAAVLGMARDAADALVVSTPLDERDSSNPEHYWGWNAVDIRGMLIAAGWAPVAHTLLDPQVLGGYTYQLWGCV